MSSQPIRVDLGEQTETEHGDGAAIEPSRSPSSSSSQQAEALAPPQQAMLPAQQAIAPAQQAMAAENHLDDLRRILLGYDDQRLDTLQGWLNDPSFRASEVSQILPRAVRLRPEGDSQLGEALGPTIETAIVDFVRRDPEAAARVLAPVMGAAIRGAVRDALAGPFRVLRLAATAPGLRWLVEARRSGVAFGEVADRHTLIYRVEYVLLFHRATGTMLVEVENPRSRKLSPEQLAATVGRVRAMLGMAGEHTAAEEGEGAGEAPADLSIVMEQGKRLVAIALVRGNAPELLRDRLTATLDAVHLERRLSLKTFVGDTAPFELCRPLMEKLLDAEYSEPRARKALWLSTAASVLVAAVALVWWLA